MAYRKPIHDDTRVDVPRGLDLQSHKAHVARVLQLLEFEGVVVHEHNQSDAGASNHLADEDEGDGRENASRAQSNNGDPDPVPQQRVALNDVVVLLGLVEVVGPGDVDVGLVLPDHLEEEGEDDKVVFLVWHDRRGHAVAHAMEVAFVPDEEREVVNIWVSVENIRARVVGVVAGLPPYR